MAEQSRKFTLGATGDILLHDRVYNKAKTKDGGYDFTEMLAEAKPLFKKDHLTIVNQESIIGGKQLGLSGYPKFNSPMEIGKTLKDFNVDLINLANNHVLDKGEKGILKSIENWEKIGIPYVGAYKSKEDQETLRIFYKNGLRICFISYTKRTVGFSTPKNKSYLVNSFGGADVRSASKLITYVRTKNIADVIIVSIHYGKEYQLEPSAAQKEISRSLSDAGADVIIGHHPHVLQPPTYILNSMGKETLVIYSLGNFLSGQKGIFRQIGAYMTIDVEKPLEDSNSLLKINNPTMKLTYVDSTDKKDFKLHLLEDIVKRHKVIKTHVGNFDSETVHNKMINHMRKWIPSLDIS